MTLKQLLEETGFLCLDQHKVVVSQMNDKDIPVSSPIVLLPEDNKVKCPDELANKKVIAWYPTGNGMAVDIEY